MTFGSQISIPRIGISFEQCILLLYPACLIPAVLLWYFELRHQKQLKLQAKGCKKIGISDYSNIKDEYDDHKYATGVDVGKAGAGSGADEPRRWKVKAMFIYPIKSCAPVELDVANVEASGMEWDRQFAFAELLKPITRLDASEEVKKPKWTFRTQRAPGFEKLVHVRPEVWVPDATAVKNMTQLGGPDKEGALIIRYPNVPSGMLALLDKFFMSLGLISSERSFRVPLIPPPGHKYPVEEVAIWKDSPKWLNLGVHVTDDFKTYLGTTNPLTLFRVDPESYREVFRCAPRQEMLGYQSVVGFADAYPVHLLNIASVRDVAAKVKQDIPRFSTRRFRSNILLAGPPAYDEDDWKRIRIGGHEFYCACHTVRCRLPNVDPETSERHPVEPDKTLKSFRCIDDGDPKNACLGLQLVPAKAYGIHLRVGDAVDVLERGEHHYIKQ